MLEVEVKVKTDLVKAEELLLGMSFEKGTTVYEKDTYFNSEIMDLKDADKALRIREYTDVESDKVSYILNFKGPKIDSSTMSRQETEFEIPDFSQGQTLLYGLGYQPAGSVEKTRTHYTKGQITCCLDHVVNLGDFLEIEIMADETAYDDAIREIENLLEKLNLTLEDSLRESYLSMLQI